MTPRQRHRMTKFVAAALAEKRYRAIYPEGIVPKEIEERAVYTEQSSGTDLICTWNYWLRGCIRQPFIFFRARVNLCSGELIVEVAEDPSTLSLDRFETGPVVPRID